MRYQQSIVVNAPAEKVFEYVSDMTRLPEWGHFSRAVRQTSQGPVGVGTTYETDGEQFGKHTDECTVAEYLPGKRFTIEAAGDAGDVRNTFELVEEGAATRLTKIQEFTKPALSAKLARPLISRLAPKNLKRDLERIKQNIEGSAG